MDIRHFFLKRSKDPAAQDSEDHTGQSEEDAREPEIRGNTALRMSIKINEQGQSDKDSRQREGHEGQREGHEGQREGHEGQREGHEGQREGHEGQREGHGGQREDHEGQREGQEGQREGHERQREDHGGQREDHGGQREGHEGQREGHGGQRENHGGQREGHEGQREGHGGQREEDTGQREELAGDSVREKEQFRQQGQKHRGPDDLGVKETGPKQIRLVHYPQKQFGLQKRACQSRWFDTFHWLEYSVTINAAFCFACRQFGKGKNDSLITNGFQNWKRALDSFREHEGTSSHKNSMLSWQCYTACATHGNIAEQLQIANVNEITERREYIRRLVAIVKLLGKQSISLRGHDETQSSCNQGNFLEIFKFLKEFDPFLQSYNPPGHSTYLSATSQNEIIECCANEITATIVKEMQESKVYSVMADEARSKHTEQLAVCVRYVTPEGVRERFLGFQKLDGFDAKTITDSIEQMLTSNDIQNLKCVAQTYDGASVMSGVVGGVQARFRENHPEAIYVHCYAHELNLVLCHTCKAIPEAREFFEMLESLFSYFSGSLVNHQKLEKVQKQLGLQQAELIQLSNTRWACQLRSVNAVLDNFSAVYQCLATVNNTIAVGLVAKLSKFSAVYLLLMFKSLLTTTEGLHQFLQRETVDLAHAVDFKEAVCDTLKCMRRDSVAKDLYEKTKSFCDINQIPEPASAGLRRKQKRMDEYVVESPCGARSEISNCISEENLKQKLYYPCLDRMLAELDQRFSSVGADLLKGIQACSPTSPNFLSEDLLEVANFYHIPLKPEEVLVAKHYFSKKKEATISDMSSVYNMLDPDMFPSLKAVIQVAMTIPVSSCSCERSFSALRRLHTWLRSTMTQDRMHQLAVMSIDKDLLTHLSESDVIDRFAQLTNRRYSLMLPSTGK